MPIIVVRKSDGSQKEFNYGPNDWVKSLKNELHTELPPAHPNGCKVRFNGKVLKSRHHLKHYKVIDGATLEMDDSKNWSSSSSSSDSTD